MKMNAPLIPVIVSDWWPITENPELGLYTTEKQQPVDFAVWQAADGTWQLWSCIHNTAIGGVTRLFHGWEGGVAYGARLDAEGACTCRARNTTARSSAVGCTARATR